MTDEAVIKTSRNCTFRLRPGTLTLTDRRLYFTGWPGRKTEVELPLENIAGVKPFRLGAVHVDTTDGGFVRVRVNAVTVAAWVDAIDQAVGNRAH